MRRKISKWMTIFMAVLLVFTGVLAVPSESLAAAKKPTKITLNAKSKSLYVGQQFTLKVSKVNPAKASKSVKFATSNKNVATVTSKGVVKAKKKGTAKITVTSKLNKKAKAVCKVTVKQQVKKITLNKTSVSLTVGQTYALKATVTPSNANSKKVTYKSSKTSVATVSSAGKITAKKAGTAKITVAAADKRGASKVCNVTVKAKPIAVTSVKLNKASTALVVGGTEKLTATIAPTNAANKNVTWTSSNTAVATVAAGTITARAAGTTTITVKTADGNKTATCVVTVSNPVVAVTGVTLNKVSAELFIGETDTLVATVLPANATNKAITWTSSNTEAATVANGVVTAVGEGESIITVTTADGNKVASYTVVVKKYVNVTGLTINPAKLALDVRDKVQLKAIIAPEDATNQNVIWNSTDPEFVTVDAEGNVEAIKATPESEYVFVIATTEEGNFMKTCMITVSNVAVSGVALDPSTLELGVGQEEELKVEFTPENATNQNVTWESDDVDVATVIDGVVTAVAPGTAVVTVTTEEGNYSDSCTVIVTENAPIKVALNETTGEVKVGETLTLTATVTGTDNTEVTWSSSDETVATVVDGVVTGVAEGEATITATSQADPSKTATCVVTVVEDEEEEIEVELNETTGEVKVGETLTLTATVTGTDNTEVTWSSSDETVATVVDGVVTGVAEGEVTITATSQADPSKTATCVVTIVSAD